MSAVAAETISFHYTTRSEITSTGTTSSIRLALDEGRDAVGLRGQPRDNALFRDVLMTTLQVLESDLRYKGRDRTAYLAYLMQQGKRANAAIWEAQKSFIDAQFADNKKVAGVLDPIVTVDPDELSLEVFSRDESAYARLAFSNEFFEGREAAHGTSFLDLPTSFLERLDRLPGYLPLNLEIDRALQGKAPAEHRSVEVPHAWLRGFLQVQSAATLPSTSCDLAPIDLYNLLFALRTRKAKNPPRGLRFELIPGIAPRLILEPWELVLESHGAPYQGKIPRVIRTFGRQRLLALARSLPYLQNIRVQMLGPGLPVFWVLDFGYATLSLALTGWSDSSWASAASFDQLMPPADQGFALSERALALLQQQGPLPLGEIHKSVGGTLSEVRSALQRECLRGRILFDMAHEKYRPRTLLKQPVADETIRFGSPREAKAHRLLEVKNGVEISKLHETIGEGVEIHGEVNDQESRRQYLPRFSIDLEGRVTNAWCNCATYQRSGLREGPCEHMVALRLHHARKTAEAEALRQTPEGRRTIRAETRVLTRRDSNGQEMVYRVSLDDKIVHIQWGQRTVTPRNQRLWYDTDHLAREAYFARLESLSTEGFVDTDAAGLQPLPGGTVTSQIDKHLQAASPSLASTSTPSPHPPRQDTKLTEERIERWKAIEAAGGIPEWIETQLQSKGLSLDDTNTSSLSDKAKSQYKERKKAEATERRALKKLAWEAYKTTHITYLGAGIHWSDQEKPDAFDLDQREAQAQSLKLEISNVKQLSDALKLSIPTLRWLTFHRDVETQSHYRRWKILKRDGVTTRTLSSPKRQLKTSQHWVLRNLLEKLPVHAAAHGFLSARSIVTNARIHAGAPLVLKVDIKDFFPSITWKRVKGLLRKQGLPESVATLLALLTTDAPREEILFRGKPLYVASGPRSLPQGAPTSPAITNAICLRLDRRLSGLARSLGFRYTRYADDLTFSWHPAPIQPGTSPRPGTGALLRGIGTILEAEGFQLNPAKTLIMRAGERQSVTGLIVNETNRGPSVRVPRETLRKLRAAIHNREKGKPGKENESFAQLKGMAAFIFMTDPAKGKELLTRIEALESKEKG